MFLRTVAFLTFHHLISCREVHSAEKKKNYFVLEWFYNIASTYWHTTQLRSSIIS